MIEKQFGKNCVGDIQKLQGREGLWFLRYTIGPSRKEPWWRADFLQDRIVAVRADGSVSELYYAEIAEIRLLPTTSSQPFRYSHEGVSFDFDKAILTKRGGGEFAVFGAVRGHLRDIYQWKAIQSGAVIDQERVGRGSTTNSDLGD